MTINLSSAGLSRTAPRILTCVIVTAVLVAAFPPDWATYAQLEDPAAWARIEAHDRGRDRGDSLPIGYDDFSYFSRAIPGGDPYLAGRAPYAYRPLVPTLVATLSPILEPRPAFRLIAILGVALQILGLSYLLRDAAVAAPLRQAAMVCYAAVPSLSLPLRYPLIIDALAWAAVIWAWVLARRNWALLSSLALATGVLAHEVALAGLFPVLLAVSRRAAGESRRHAWLFFAAPPLLALVLPRLIFEVTWDPSLRIFDRLDPANLSLRLIPDLLYGLGVAGLCLPVLIRDSLGGVSRASRDLDREAVSLALPLLTAVLILPVAIGRLLVLAGAATAILLTNWVSIRGAQARLTSAVWIAGSLLAAVSWSIQRGTAYAVGLSALSLFGVMLAVSRRSVREGGSVGM